MRDGTSDLQGLPSGPQSVMDFVNAQKSRLHNVIGEIEKAGWIEDEEVKKAVKETMDKWIKERFVPVPGEAKHSTLDQIKNDLKELSSQNLENVIKTTDAKLGVVSNDPDLASSEDVRKYVRTCREALEAAKSYQGQDEVTIAGLVERFRALKVANTQLDSLAQVDKLIKDRIQEDVNRLSEEVKDIKRFQPEPFSSRNFGIADVLNPERRVEDFQRALKQKNQPEAIYRVLQSLQCEPKAIEKFENEIWKKYKKTLETILRDHFGKPKDRARLEHALQLINKGDQGVGQAIRPLPDLEGQPLVSKLCQVLGDISERIHQALHPSDGVSKPKDVCNMLSIFDRNPDLVSELEDAYKNTSGNTNRTDLRSAIAQKLSGESLLLAQQLMGDQVSEKKQVSQDRATRLAKMLLIYHELLSVAERLNVALADPTLKPETVYAILTPFRRNTKLWCKLGDIYQKRYKMDLRSSIAAKLQGDSLIYARYLIGDKVLEDNIGDYKNLLLFQKALSGVTFDRDDGMSIPVPYGSPLCSEPESHIMCQVLKGIGCRSKKIVAHYLCKNDSGGKEANLHVRTDFAPDRPSGQAPTVTLGYRMATLVEVETPFGVREFVIDPSLSDCPLTVENWTAKMSPDVFKRISVADFKAELDTEAQFNPTFPYPVGPHLFETSRNYYRLPTSNDIRRLEDLEANPDNKSINDSTALVTYNKDGMTTIANKAEWAPYFIMANFIRKNMHSIDNEASAKKFLNTITKGFLKDVSTFHSIKNTNFSSAYPNLYQDLTHIVKTHISASIAESFEKLLSGDSALSGAKRDQDIFSADSVHDIESDIRMRADQSSDTRKAEDVESSKDVKDPEEALQKEVDRWPLETIHIERIQRPIFLRDCKMADVLDFKQLVDDFDAALEPGKQPEDLYRVLYPLLREQEAIDKLDNAYKGKHGKTLETALKDHLGQIGDSAQLEYALQLVNKGDSEAVEAIKRLPANPSEDELDEVAKRIHQALKGPNPQPKVVYAALMSFERNTELLCKLDERYNDKFQTGLKSHIEDTLKENLKAKDYALFLIGDQAMEKQEMSEYEAMRLWKVVQRLTFDRGDGVRVPVPYDHPREGCGSRAHAIAHALKEMGYASEKIFVQSLRLNEHKQKVDDLHVYTDLAPDMPSDQKPGLAWSNHIACCIQIKTEAGGNELLVFDPSLSARPLTMKNWMSKMGKDSYELISLKDYSTRLAEEYQSDPAKPYQAGTFLLIAGNNFMGQPLTPDALACWLKDESIPGQNAFEDNRKEPMINNAKRVPYNRMARSIRKGLRKPTIQNADTFLAKLATEFLANVSEYRSSTNSAFSEAFSNLYKDLIEYIRTRVGEASSEDFRGHLSGESRIDV